MHPDAGIWHIFFDTHVLCGVQVNRPLVPTNSLAGILSRDIAADEAKPEKSSEHVAATSVVFLLRQSSPASLPKMQSKGDCPNTPGCSTLTISRISYKLVAPVASVLLHQRHRCNVQ